MTRSPRLSRALVRLLVHPRDRDHFLDDLDDGFAAHVEREGLASWRLLGALLGAFAAIAVAIAAIGIYGVMSYAVTQRTQEFGIRMALGADRRAVLRMVLRQSGVLVLCGIVLGGIGALGTGRVLAFQLYEVSARDPLVLGGVAAILALVSIAAAFVPARRATTVDPMIALRAP
jgi:putative ABC transport system permease protein